MPLKSSKKDPFEASLKQLLYRPGELKNNNKIFG